MYLQDIVRHELIGLTIEIIKSVNPSLVGIKGKVVDETKNTLSIKHDNKIKKILKDQVIIQIKIKKRTIQIDGKLLVKRPEERLKK